MNVMIDKIIRKRLESFQQYEKPTTGFLGRADGTVRVPGKAHWFYVRLWNGEVIEAFNSGNVPVAFGLAVRVAYRNGRYYTELRDVYDQPTYVGLPDGAEEELQWPGNHTLYVRPEQFLPGLVVPKSGLTVIVYGGNLPLVSGGYVAVPTREIDLTPYRPTSNAVWVTLGWSNAGAIVIKSGGIANSLGELSISNIPSSGGYDLAAVKMHNGQTSISHGKYGSMIVDLRFFKTFGSSQELQIAEGHAHETWQWIGNGSQTTFDLPDEAQGSGIAVYDNGARLDTNDYYISENRGQITFVSPPQSGHTIIIDYILEVV